MNVPESRSEFDHFSGAFALQKEDELSGETHPILDYAMHLAFYAALTALITKLLCNYDEEGGSGEAAAAEGATEQSRLLPPKEEAVYSSYGTSWNDLESGSTSSSEDLYDGKICVICYDEKRSCFFVPCGHCVACHTCANRIVREENKSCPICRGIIDKVRKLYIL
ncbi:E3 ubiquitin-protein ligase APD2-like isoform X2 [Andrographis paniculata]|uniref:E3 ubiquitin-protein ligase APD2-like isoform X2 n=1 Tax=Andrographis paniculata TaxID=175694 RepID=UPI0021E7B3A6|nr:E3 ubiquitin-protein ligase APD2-like isoform X2 [Andrographis paniculata]